MREYGKENRVLLDDIKNLTPDLILLGGDFVTEEKIVKEPLMQYVNWVNLCGYLKLLNFFVVLC